MLRFVELHYANAIAFYQEMDGYGSRASASASCIFYSLGIVSIWLNAVQYFSGSLAPLVRSVLPYFDRPYDNAAEYVLALPFAFTLQYFWLWRRTPALLARHPWVSSYHPRWLLGVGIGLSVVFFVITTFGRDHLFLSTGLALGLLVAQEGLRIFVERKHKCRGSSTF